MKNFSKTTWHLFVLFFIVGLPFLISGQITTFEKHYHFGYINQSGRDVLTTSDGGYIITGMTETSIPDDSDIIIMKTNNLGDTLWTKTYGGTQADYPYAILNTNDGNYFIVGFTKSFGAGNSDTWLLKINPSGDTLWSKTYGGSGYDEARNIIATIDGNYMIVGRSKTGSNDDAYLMKINPAGTIIWKKNYGGPQIEIGHSVKECLDGGFVFMGQTWSYGKGMGDIYLIKTNPAGDTTWTKTFGGVGTDDGNDILVNTDSTFTIGAETNSPDPQANGDIDVELLKVDMNGMLIWKKFYGGTNKDVCHMIQATTDGGYIIAATSRSFSWIKPDMWLIKTNSIGDTIWTRRYGYPDPYHEHSYSVKQTTDGGYLFLGHSEDINWFKQVYFLKLNQDGKLEPLGTNEFALDKANTIKVYPNPSDGVFNINFESEIPLVLKISNSLGQVIFSESDNSLKNGNSIINLKGQKPGIYFLSLETKDRVTTKKIVFQ